MQTVIPQKLEIDTYFYQSESLALNKYEEIKADFKQYVADENFELLVPDGIEGGENIELDLSSKFDFDRGILNFWLDTGDINLGVILYDCAFEEDCDVEDTEV